MERNVIEISTGAQLIEIKVDGNRSVELEFNPEDADWVDMFFSFVENAESTQKDMPSAGNEAYRAAFDELAEKNDLLFGEGFTKRLLGDKKSLFALIQFLQKISPFIGKVRTELLNGYLEESNEA